jgi:hypothetical protein
MMADNRRLKSIILFAVSRFEVGYRMKSDSLKVVAVAVCVTMLLGTGCEDSSDDEPAVSGADPQANFAVVYPQAGETVDSEVVTVTGIGFREAAGMMVSVYTDQWHNQSGTFRHSDNNSWSYSPVYLSGRDQYNNHAIRVTAIHEDGTTETVEIRGIVRE